MRAVRKVGGAALCSAVMVLAWSAASSHGAVQAAGPAGPYGNVNVTGIAVSPIFDKTGLAMVADVRLGCKTDCVELWRSVDGGASWTRARAQGWPQNVVPVIGVSGDGHEQLIAGAAKGGIARSDDGGDTWQVGLPPAAFVSVAPTYPHDGLIAVVGDQGNFALRSSGPQPVLGSGGAYLDETFMFSPAYPVGGGNPPALLVALDKQTGQPGVVGCDAHLWCTGARAPLAVTTTMPSAVTLFPSEAFASDGVVWAQSEAGLWRSTDGGRSFVPLTVGQPGATQSAITAMALAPGYGNGGNRSAYVAVWQVFADKTPSRNPQTYTRGGIYRTTDGGVSWSGLTASAPKFETGAGAVAAAAGGRLLGAWTANGSQGGVMCSSDGGSTWADACAPLHGASMAARSGGACPGGGGCAATAAGSAAVPGATAASSANAGSSSGGGSANSGTAPLSAINTTTPPSGLSGGLWAGMALVGGVCGLSLIGWGLARRRRPGA